MEEIYTFPARVAERWGNGQIQIVPEDPAEFMSYRGRAGLQGNEDWAENPQGMFVTVSNQQLVARSVGAQRVLYSVQARGQGQNRKMWAVDLQPA